MDAINFLERWYGVEIEITNAPAKPMTCNGKFTHENLDNVLNTLGFSLGFDYKINGKAVEIFF